MSLTRHTLDDDALAEQMQRGWDEVYYGADWPSEQECQDDAERYLTGEPVRPDSQA